VNRRGLQGAVLIAALVATCGTGIGADPDLSGLVEPYLQARRQEALGMLAAKAYVEPLRPSGEPKPQPAVSLVLLPYSAAFEAQLDAVKAGLRDSVDSYVQAVGRIEAARVEYERALVTAGAGELVRNETTDARGSVELPGLPAGDWLLLAWHEGGYVSKQNRLQQQDLKKYQDFPTAASYSVVTYWRSRVTVRKGETVEVSLTDRSIWMTAGRQEGTAPSRQRRPAGSDQQRRP